MRERTKQRRNFVIALGVAIVALLMLVPEDAESFVWEDRVEYIYRTVYVQPEPHPADSCQEDEDWVTVHWETPGAHDMNNGTRQCVARDDFLWGDGGILHQLNKDGVIIFEWDL